MMELCLKLAGWKVLLAARAKGLQLVEVESDEEVLFGDVDKAIALKSQRVVEF